jgi:hypothetical protein
LLSARNLRVRVYLARSPPNRRLPLDNQELRKNEANNSAASGGLPRALSRGTREQRGENSELHGVV